VAFIKMKNKAKNGNLPIYSLFSLLFKESEFITIQADLLSRKKLKRSQKKQYKSIQSKLFKHWNEFENRKNSADPICPWKLLKIVAALYS
jgi:hypothetical protein